MPEYSRNNVRRTRNQKHHTTSLFGTRLIYFRKIVFKVWVFCVSVSVLCCVESISICYYSCSIFSNIDPDSARARLFAFFVLILFFLSFLLKDNSVMCCFTNKSKLYIYRLSTDSKRGGFAGLNGGVVIKKSKSYHLISF